MRKFVVFVSLLCLLCTLFVGASAATGAKSVSSHATVTADGRCQITLTAAIHLDAPVEKLRFPLPKNADNITVNGSHARVKRENGLKQVDVSKFVGKTAGDFTLTFNYSLPDLVRTNEADLLELTLPLLSGFAYPVQTMEFTVTLPGEITAKPAFSSGYHQANIEKDITCTTEGPTVTGTSQVELKDHETLVMTLIVDDQMFPRTIITPPDLETVNVIAIVCFVAALLYWLLFLRNLPWWPGKQPTPPEGYGPGEMGSVLHLQGGNLNMMVFSWAQLGYLQIRTEKNGPVRLVKQMEMGNERSSFEQRCFKLLFGSRDVANASSRRYGAVYCAVEKLRPNLTALIHPKSGNLTVFRILTALTGLFCGVGLALLLTDGAALQWFWIVVLGAAAWISSWQIQLWARHLFAPQQRKLWVGLGWCGFWLLLGLIAGQVSTAAALVFSQLFAGLLLAFGGRRTYAGKQAMEQAMSMRRYFKTVSAEDLQRIKQNNPEYFHQMMPLAIALGADKAFAKSFGKELVGQCPYISDGINVEMRAGQWRLQMRQILERMNTLPEQTRTEKVIAFVESLRK